MGLDMNFYKRIYLHPMKKRGLRYPSVRVGKYTESITEKQAPARTFKDVCYVLCEAGYLRKANAIHKYIVDKCFDGDDPNCRDIIMPTETIKELRAICQAILRKKNVKLAQKNLPTEDGFFFGSQEYDDWYFDGLKQFLEFSDKWELDNDDVEYIYHPWY